MAVLRAVVRSQSTLRALKVSVAIELRSKDEESYAVVLGKRQLGTRCKQKAAKVLKSWHLRATRRAGRSSPRRNVRSGKATSWHMR